MNRLNLLYDMRAPDSGAPADTLYRAAVEQCAWADAPRVLKRDAHRAPRHH